MFLCLMTAFMLANSADPDEMPQDAAFYLGLHCFPIYQLSLILTVLLHVAWLTWSISRHVPLLGHDDVALFE